LGEWGEGNGHEGEFAGAAASTRLRRSARHCGHVTADAIFVQFVNPSQYPHSGRTGLSRETM
jgi:hypothetical protein